MLHADSDLICDQPETTQKQRPEEEEASLFFKKRACQGLCVCLLCSSRWSVSGKEKNLRLCLSQCRMSCPSVSNLVKPIHKLFFSFFFFF